MRALPVLAVLLGFALACGGSNPITERAAVESIRLDNGEWPSTAEGVCAHLDECGCNPAPTQSICVAQQKMAVGVVQGALSLQGEIVELGLQGDQSAEAKMMRDVMELGGDLVEGGVQTGMAAMANADCPTLCEEMAKQSAEFDL
ncbi:MAG: hypothetical protein KC912_08915 [Proteobacteria bacterium]|nr:hypothetical protein [Pseudomonadota bacterium]